MRTCFRRYCFILTLALALICSYASSALANSPAEKVSQVVEKLKSAGNLGALVDHIHWKWRFEKLSADEKKVRGFSSAADLRNFYAAIAKANGSGVVETLKEDARVAAPANRSKALDHITQVSAELERQQREFRLALSETSYKVGSIKREGDTLVIINLEKSKGVAIQSDELRMHLVNGDWLFESAAPLNPLPITFGGTPFGKLPEPAAILGQL